MRKSSDIENFFTAMVPGGIEESEKRGQMDLKLADELPIDGSKEIREKLEALGFVFGADVDDLFVACKLPEGWTKEPTDHSMWSNLLDPQGRKRGMIFYKAAFYDRKAHMQMERRYSAEGYVQAGENYDVIVKDGATGETLKHVGSYPRRDYQAGDELRKTAFNWLNENFPEHRDTFAYW